MKIKDSVLTLKNLQTDEIVIENVPVSDLKFENKVFTNEANKCVCEKCGGICQENDLYGDINPVYLCENCFTKTWQGEDKIEY